MTKNKTKTVKIGSEEYEVIYNIGEIIDYTFDRGYGESEIEFIKTATGEYVVSMKISASIVFGFVKTTKIVHDDKKHQSGLLKGKICFDPRVVFLNVYFAWCRKNNKKIKKIPIPTMEEATEWLKKRGVPICDITIYNLWFDGKINADEKLRQFFMND